MPKTHRTAEPGLGSLPIIPPEIRLEIFEHILASTATLRRRTDQITETYINDENSLSRRLATNPTIHHTAVLRTSRSIYYEAVMALYGQNRFRSTISNTRPPCSTPMHPQMGMMRHITLGYNLNWTAEAHEGYQGDRAIELQLRAVAANCPSLHTFTLILIAPPTIG